MPKSTRRCGSRWLRSGSETPKLTSRLTRGRSAWRAVPGWRTKSPAMQGLSRMERTGIEPVTSGLQRRRHRSPAFTALVQMELTRQVRAPPRGYPAARGCWRTDDRRSPHRMLCGLRLVERRTPAPVQWLTPRNPSLLGRYAVADAERLVADPCRDPFDLAKRFFLLREVLVKQFDRLLFTESLRHAPQSLVGSDLVFSPCALPRRGRRGR